MPSTCDRGDSRYALDILMGAVKPIMGFMLIVFLGLNSTESRAEEKASAFQNIINKVSRSGTLLMLQAICDAGKAGFQDGLARCTVCPSFTSLHGKKSGFDLANIVLGSFTQPREPEALLYMRGCETDKSMDGGIVLLQQTADGWSRLQYQKSVGFSECLKFRTLKDVSNLLCNHSSLTNGDQTGSIFWMDLAENRFSKTTLLRWYDNSNSNPRELVSVFPYRFLRSDFNQDSRGDVRISFRIREQYIPEKYPGALDAINAGYKLEAPRLLNLTYLFNGVSLKLQKESEKDLLSINQILNKHLPTLSQ